MHDARVPAEDVGGDHAGEVDRILGRIEGRRVGQFQIRQVLHRQARAQRHGQRVDALVHTLVADHLGTQDVSVRGEQKLEVELRPARIVGGIGSRMDEDLLVGTPHRLQAPLGQPDTGRREPAQLQHGRAVAAPVDRRAAGDVLRDNARLAVGWPGQGNGRLAARDRIGHLDHIAGRVDCGVGRAEMLVHDQVSSRPQREPRRTRQLAVGPDADAKEHQVGRQPRAVIQHDLQRLRRRFEGGDPASQAQVDAGRGQFLRQEDRHLLVERRQHLVAQLDNRDVETARPQVLGGLEADETGPHHDGPPRPGADPRHDRVHVRNRPEPQHARVVGAGQGQRDGRRARREHEPVVRLAVRRAILPPYRHRPFLAVDGDGLALRADIDAEPGPELFRGHDHQRPTFGNDPADMVREPAIRVGNMGATLQQHDLRRLVQAPQARRRARAGGHAADNDCLHPCSILSRYRRPPMGAFDIKIS